MKGVGALLSPLAATALASSGVRFSYFFSISLGLALLNSISLFFAFGRDPECGPQRKVAPQNSSERNGHSIELQETGIGSPSGAATPMTTDSTRPLALDTERIYSTSDKNKLIFKSKIVWATALFLFF